MIIGGKGEPLKKLGQVVQTARLLATSDDPGLIPGGGEMEIYFHSFVSRLVLGGLSPHPRGKDSRG